MMRLLRNGAEGTESYTPPKVGAASSAPPRKDGSFEDFPEALDAEDDDLPF